MNIEAKMASAKIDLLFRGSQEIQEKRAKSAFLENSCHIAVSCTVPATAAAVREQNDTGGVLWYHQVSGQAQQRNLYGMLNKRMLHGFLHSSWIGLRHFGSEPGERLPDRLSKDIEPLPRG